MLFFFAQALLLLALFPPPPLRCPRQLYPGACDGIFFDESPFLLGDMLDIYTAHNTFAHQELDLAPDAVSLARFPCSKF